MRSRLMFRLLLSLGLLLTAFSSSNAAVSNRIASVNGNSRVAVPGTVSGRVKLATDLGPAPAATKLESLSLRFSLTPAQQADLTQLLAAQLNPSSPSYHQWLTPEQYGARFGLSSTDLAKVSSWLTSQGFTIIGTARSSTFIRFSGTVAQAQQAFATSIHTLSLNGEQHISNTTDPVLPASIAGVVTAVTGLNDFKLKPRSRVRSVQLDPANPHYTQTVGGVTSYYIAPSDFYTIYDFNPLLTNSITGTGFTIAVVGQTDPTLTDVAAFRAAAGLPPSVPKTTLCGGPLISGGVQTTCADPGTVDAFIDESNIDMEWAGAAAPGATILYVYGQDALLDSLTGAVDNAVAPIISSSYGECESFVGAAELSSLNQTLQEANTKGITVISAAGDAGATDCEDPELGGLAVGGLNVDFPGSSPFATSAGGTMFSGDVNTPGTYWSSTNSTTGYLGGSALSYIPEQPWNETTATGGLTPGGAGGGGASAFFAKPSWQLTGSTVAGNTPCAGCASDDSRDVPDIAFNAASNHDGYVVCSQGSCTNGFLTSTGELNVFGGTSFVAPSFSGLLALVEQKLGGTPGTGIGNVNPILYGLANGPTYSSVFHDITTGSNSVPCSQGTPNCPNGGAIGYNAGPGYDQASGLGTIDAANLVNSWATATPAGGGGSPIGAVLSNTTVTTSATLCGISSTTLALSVSVTTGSTAPATYTGQPISSAVPTGMVQILVDNAAVGTPQPLVNGSATFSMSTATISSGGHTISAVYSGDSTFAGSKGTLLAADGTLASVDFVSSTKPDFALTPCTAAVTVQSGAVAAGITFTITPANGFTGTVNFVATDNNLAAATTAFTVSPVTVSSATGVTTSFVFTASAPTTTAQLKPSSVHPRSGRAPWYAAGSGATLACMLLLTVPRRRRWSALLAAVLSVAALTAIGCSNNSSTTGGGGGGGGTTPTTPTPSGTYTYTITAISGNLVHSAQVVVTVP
jgi:subtilase family serine protease